MTAPLPNTLVLIPVYNHAPTLRAVVQGCLDAGWPVLVVDDGSTDGSLDGVAELPIERLRLPVNRGKGAAILAGAARAEELGFESVLTLDADGQHDPRDAARLLDAARSEWPCIVVGARAMDGPDVPPSSRFGKDFSNFWVRLECGCALPDTQSGYRLYPTAFLLSRRFQCRRYTFEIEVMVRGAWAGLPILSVPVSVHYPPGKQRVSHFHKFRDNLRLSMLHTWLVLRALLPWPHRRWTRARNEKAARVPGGLLAHLRQLTREHTRPVQLAGAVWVGIFVGSLPIIPFGLAAIVYVSHKLHLNKLVAAGASNLCVAPFVPFLCIQVGHYLRYGHFWSEFNRQTLVHQIHLRLWEWLLGALLLGPLLATAGAALTYLILRIIRTKTV